MRMKLISILLLLSSLSFAKEIKVLEIDTGVGKEDTHGHGSHIAGIIMKNVCPEVKLISCVYYNPHDTAKQIFKNEIECFKSALVFKPDIVNYSSGGPHGFKEEYKIIKKLSDLGIKIIVAAGNDGQDLSQGSEEEYSYFPAEYDIKNLVAVGNLDEDGIKHPSSNYNIKNMVWEIGTNIYSDYLNGTHRRMTGTSQAAAAHTNRLLKQMCLENK